MTPVFLSYASLDNDKDAHDRLAGWVTYFYERLRLALQAKLGRRPDFWRDVEEIQRGDVWHEPIMQALAQAKVLLSILSPGYLASENCCFELNHFLDSQAGRERDAIAQSVIKVLKEEVDVAQLPSAVREPEAYQFFVPDRVRGNLPYYDPAVGLREDRAQEFLDELNGLANRLASLLRAGEANEADPPVATVFVAVPSPKSALANAYATIVAELNRRNVKVVPDRKRFYAQLDTPDRIVLEQAVTTSMLAVHLLDPTAGEEAMAFDRRQLEGTAARARLGTNRLQRLLWLAPKPQDVADNELVRGLRRSDDNGGSLLAADGLIEQAQPEFVAILIRKLFPNGDPAAPLVSPAPLGGKDARPCLYLVAPPEEIAAAKDGAVPHLKDRFRCRLPLTAESTPAERAGHEAAQFRQADAVAIYWGQAKEAWVYEQLTRLADWGTLGRKAAFTHLIILIAPPSSAAKAAFYLDDEGVELLDLRQAAGPAPAVPMAAL